MKWFSKQSDNKKNVNLKPLNRGNNVQNNNNILNIKNSNNNTLMD